MIAQAVFIGMSGGGYAAVGSRQSAKKRKVYHKLQSFNHYPITSFPHLIISSDTE